MVTEVMHPVFIAITLGHSCIVLWCFPELVPHEIQPTVFQFTGQTFRTFVWQIAPVANDSSTLLDSAAGFFSGHP